MSKIGKMALGILMTLLIAGTARAADIDVTANITGTGNTWTKDNVYHLKDVIYIEPNGELTIQEGTTIIGYKASELPGTDSSALVVCRGAKLFADGTLTEPIIFTSSHDTGAWRPVNSEWGNLTILGAAIIAEGTATGGVQDGTCVDNMEGLGVSALSEYGGDDDDDSSGSISYVQLRYGGSVIGTANELNGLSLGGVGRGTDMHHIEIMNNVDDGIEIWGGTVCLKYVSIWNIGDDSFDLDEGYRGQAQFGLIVQGYSNPAASQGSGAGDNCFEMDGGEHPDNMQPYANPQVYNFTVIGEPNGGDQALAFRDNMRIQIGNSIFMDIGDKLVSMEGAFDQMMDDAFTTAYDTYDTTGYDAAWLAGKGGPSALYSSSRSGMWSQVQDSIFYNYSSKGNAAVSGDPIDSGSDIHDSFFDGTNRNIDDQTGTGAMPIVLITREATVGHPGLGMHRVISLDPRAAGNAKTCSYTAPDDSYFTPVSYIGAFSEKNNWLEGWSASDAFGFLANTGNNPSEPTVTIQLTATSFFQTVADADYLVEKSDDNVNWTTLGTVKGDGSIMNATDLDALSPARFYSVTVL